MASKRYTGFLAACCFLCTPAQALVRTQRSELDIEVLSDADLEPQSATGERDLVLMHVPYNFGHTIEKVALYPPSFSRLELGNIMRTMGGFEVDSPDQVERVLQHSLATQAKPDGIAWGHFSPELQETSNVTGCAMYFTPQKYWPKDLAAKYFGDKKVFGMLRNPYERLVAMVRGSRNTGMLGNYGNDFDRKYIESCDLNAAIKQMLKKFMKSDNPFESACAYLPQAEYFDGPYGITEPVDNMKFPTSFNELMSSHGYDDIQVRTEDILHVTGCPQKWSADLDSETKGLIRQVYKRDFELRCKHFGECDDMKDQCIHGAPFMCPDSQCHGAERCAQEMPGSPFAPGGLTDLFR